MINLDFYCVFDYTETDSGIYEYASAEFAEMINSISGNGILSSYGNAFEITNNGLSLSVGTGACFIGGRYGNTTGSKTINLDACGTGLERIDRIVLEASLSSQTVGINVIKGSAAASALAPSLTQTEITYQIPLYQAKVTDGSTVTLTDERTYLSNLETLDSKIRALQSAFDNGIVGTGGTVLFTTAPTNVNYSSLVGIKLKSADNKDMASMQGGKLASSGKLVNSMLFADKNGNPAVVITYYEDSAASFSIKNPDGGNFIDFNHAYSTGKDNFWMKNPQTTTGSANVVLALDSTQSSYYLARVSSTRKVKKNIETVTDSLIDKLRPVYYESLIEGDKGRYLGFIAEEMDEACPELTEYDENNEPCSVRYDRVAVLLVAEAQAMRKRIAELEERIGELEGKNA